MPPISLCAGDFRHIAIGANRMRLRQEQDSVNGVDRNLDSVAVLFRAHFSENTNPCGQAIQHHTH